MTEQRMIDALDNQAYLRMQAFNDGSCSYQSMIHRIEVACCLLDNLGFDSTAMNQIPSPTSTWL